MGKGERENASQAGAISFWSALSVCTAVSVIGLIFVEPILLFCGASANTIEFGKSYLMIMLLGSPFIGMQMALGGLLRSEGATRESMIGMMAGSILNMVLGVPISWQNIGVPCCIPWQAGFVLHPFIDNF